MKVEQLRPDELSRWLDDDSAEPPLLLDVREPWEYAFVHLAGSVSMPMAEIAARLGELDTTGRPIVCVCHHGARSFQIAYFLASRGLGPIYNLAGGIDAWSRDVDPDCPQY